MKKIFTVLIVNLFAIFFFACSDQESDNGYSLQNSGLPVLYYDTDNGQTPASKEEWINGSCKLSSSDGSTILDLGIATIKGRGNSTWTLPKKPFAIKLKNKSSILEMPNHNRWVLLANYLDKTLLRNDFALHLGKNIFDNLSWTPDSKHIELFLNSEYLGVYQLTEQIKIDKKRLNIPNITETDLNEGGFLIEVNCRLDELYNFTTKKGVPISLKDPDVVDDEIFNYIKNKIQSIEDIIYSEGFADSVNGYSKYIDVNSFIDWYLINELTKNKDADFSTSVYMYYNPITKKIHMGPIWDFDISCGNHGDLNLSSPDGFWIKKSLWISRLFEDPEFLNAVKKRWNKISETIHVEINTYIREKADYLKIAQKNNFWKWDLFNVNAIPNPDRMDSYNGEVTRLVDWLNKRYTWMDTNINALQSTLLQ